PRTRGAGADAGSRCPRPGAGAERSPRGRQQVEELPGRRPRESGEGKVPDSDAGRVEQGPAAPGQERRRPVENPGRARPAQGTVGRSEPGPRRWLVVPGRDRARPGEGAFVLARLLVV